MRITEVVSLGKAGSPNLYYIRPAFSIMATGRSRSKNPLLGILAVLYEVRHGCVRQIGYAFGLTRFEPEMQPGLST